MTILPKDPRPEENRLVKLEREVRHLRWFIAIVLLSWVPFFLMKIVQPLSTLEAERLVIRDANGQMRGLFSSLEDDSFLSLYDEKGRLQMALDATGYGPKISFHDPEGRQLGSLGIRSREFGLSLYNAERKIQASLSVAKSGPHLSLFDSREKTRAVLTIGVQNSDGEPSYSQGPSFTLFDENGKSLFSAP